MLLILIHKLFFTRFICVRFLRALLGDLRLPRSMVLIKFKIHRKSISGLGHLFNLIATTINNLDFITEG